MQKMKAKSSIEAKNEILEQMKGINFKSDEDKVLIFDMQEEPEGKAIFDYEEYLEEQKTRKDA
ncbi:hypothetical protein CHCC20442_1513 [Bacillus licheniformis]|uniref:hypothetical protein n=1 Tax=Bacillus licheniformis TaxID=1402 RepID=UPI0011A55658|nr:hypothetical protein [Bacillus licheniformis]TWJ96553.1 hypothetical protein CHCC20442_1513 [Bacillus licheniformis]